MNKAKLAFNLIVASIALCFVASCALFYVYRVQIIALIVENAMVQKAPDDYPRHHIKEAFARSVDEAERGTVNKQELLESFFRISQRLERTQHLSAEEIKELLDMIPGADGGDLK